MSKNCENCQHSFYGFAESSMIYGLRCSETDESVYKNDTCSSFELNHTIQLHNLQFQLKQKDEEIEKLKTDLKIKEQSHQEKLDDVDDAVNTYRRLIRDELAQKDEEIEKLKGLLKLKTNALINEEVMHDYYVNKCVEQNKNLIKDTEQLKEAKNIIRDLLFDETDNTNIKAEEWLEKNKGEL